MATYANSVCTIGNFEFSFNGANLYIWGPGDASVPASAVTVTPYGTGTANDPTGFTFSANNWTTTNVAGDPNNPTSADINITFDTLLLAPLPYQISNTTLTLDVSIANESGEALVSAGENITDNTDLSTIGSITLGAFGNTDATSLLLGGTALSQTAYFQSRNVEINKDILLLAVDQNQVKLNSILETFTYSTVPEPGAFVLTAAGIGLLFLLRKRKHAASVLGILVLVAAAGSAHATSLCTSGTLQDYIDGGPCTLGGITFTFSPSSYTVSGNGTAPTTSGIIVTPILAANHQVGFQFTPNSPAVITSGTQTEHVTLTYTAQADAATIMSFTARDTASALGTGTLSGSNVKLAKGATTISTVTLPAKASGGGTGTPAFAPVIPNTLLTITNSFTLSSSGTIANNAHLSNFTNTLAAVPEPVTSLLCGAGLLAIGLGFRSRKSNT